MRKAYQIGEAPTLTVTFHDAEGNLVDPDIVTLKVLTPDKDIVPLTPTRKSLGVWGAIYSLVGAKPGKYTYRFEGTGIVQAAAEDIFAVVESAFP
jgi:hypothetical protein